MKFISAKINFQYFSFSGFRAIFRFRIFFGQKFEWANTQFHGNLLYTSFNKKYFFCFLQLSSRQQLIKLSQLSWSIRSSFSSCYRVPTALSGIFYSFCSKTSEGACHWLPYLVMDAKCTKQDC